MKLPIFGLILWFSSGLAANGIRPLVLSRTVLLPQVQGGFNHHSADGPGHRVFLCATANKSVEVLDLDTGTILRTIRGEIKPSAVCYASDLRLLCVSRGNSIELYDGHTFDRLTVIPMSASIDEMHYDPRTRELFAGSMTPPHTGIERIDLAGRKSLGLIVSPQPQGFALEEGGRRVFVCTPRAAQVSVADRGTGASLGAWKLTNVLGDYSVAYDASTHRLFVGCRNPARLLVFNADTGRAIAALDIGADTDDLSFDPLNRRVYVACGAGQISVIQQDDADHYHELEAETTAAGARNCIFVRETGALCVTVPQRGSRPAAVLIYQTPWAR